MFENIKTIRISDQIATQIRHRLLEGKLKTGEKLSTEFELAEQFGVSRASVREALKALEAEGLVERRKNGGTFVRRYSLSRILDSVEFPRKMDHELFADMVEAREKLELQVVELAAQRADVADFLRLEKTLEMMEGDLAAGRSGIQADILFHQCLAGATKNHFLAGLVRSIGQNMKETRERTLTVPGRLSECLQEHRLIYQAVRYGDAELGCRLIQEHLSKVRQTLEILNTTTRE